MVGIAGKSKGCTTCRRRKIRVGSLGQAILIYLGRADKVSQCDLHRPTCQNCSRSRRTCEGYERYPVFVNRTDAGLQKRIPLEEAKPASAVCTTFKESSSDVTPIQLQTNNVPPFLQSGAIEGAAFLSWYWDSLAPSLYLKGSLEGRVSHWIYHIITLASPHPALDHSLRAIAVTRCGLAYEDPILLNQGRRLYVRSLSLLQRSLYNPELAALDETLATVCIMVLYEVCQFII